MKYTESNLTPEILRAVAEMGYEDMTPIQEQAIPVLLEHKDVIGQAQTGTGKTAAFGIPLVMGVDPKSRELQAVVLCPTRELAIQAAEEIRRFAKYMHGVRVLPIYGGQEIYKQIKALKGGVQIIVGTPGRVMDHMRRHTIRMEHVKMVVLDEADEMLNMGFREDMEAILQEITGEHQTALFSATMPEPILAITGRYQKPDAEMLCMVKEELTIPLVKQRFYPVRSQYKEEAAARLLEYYDLHRALIFCNTKKMVDELAGNLKNRGFLAEGLHGDLTQNQRDVVMKRFRNGSLEILIATDVAARGIDVDDVEAVLNFDIPQDIEYYVHRIGRTGRAGKTGRAFTLASGKELFKIREIEKICNTHMKEGKIPTPEALMSRRAQKVLQKAKDLTLEEKDLQRLTQYLTEACEEEQMELLTLAAALLKQQMGQDVEEIEDMRDSFRRNMFPAKGHRGGRGKDTGRGGRFGEKSRGGKDGRFGERSRSGKDGRFEEKSRSGKDGRFGEKSRSGKDGRFGEKNRNGKDGRFGEKSRNGKGNRMAEKSQGKKGERFNEKTRSEKKEQFREKNRQEFSQPGRSGFRRERSEKG